MRFITLGLDRKSCHHTIFYSLRIKLLSAKPPKFKHSGSGVEIKTSFAALMAYLEYLGKSCLVLAIWYITYTHVSFKNRKSEQLPLQTKIIEIPLSIQN